MAFPLILAGGTVALAGIASFFTSKATEDLRGRAGGGPTVRVLTGPEIQQRRLEVVEAEALFQRDLARSEQAERRLADVIRARERDEELRARVKEAEARRQFERDQLGIELAARVREAEARRQQELEILEERRIEARQAAELAAAVRTQEARISAFARFQAALPEGASAAVEPGGGFAVIPRGSLLTASDIEAGLSPLPFTGDVPVPISVLSGRTFRGAFVPPGRTPEDILREQFAPTVRRGIESAFPGFRRSERFEFR